jgi:hypothetical protein
MPKIQATYDKYHSQGLEIIGISLDRNKDDLTSFLKTRKMAWPQIYDGPDQKVRVSDLYAPKGIPFLVLIGRDGKNRSGQPARRSRRRHKTRSRSDLGARVKQYVDGGWELDDCSHRLWGCKTSRTVANVPTPAEQETVSSRGSPWRFLCLLFVPRTASILKRQRLALP